MQEQVVFRFVLEDSGDGGGSGPVSKYAKMPTGDVAVSGAGASGKHSVRGAPKPAAAMAAPIPPAAKAATGGGFGDAFRMGFGVVQGLARAAAFAGSGTAAGTMAAGFELYTTYQFAQAMSANMQVQAPATHAMGTSGGGGSAVAPMMAAMGPSGVSGATAPAMAAMGSGVGGSGGATAAGGMMAGVGGAGAAGSLGMIGIAAGVAIAGLVAFERGLNYTRQKLEEMGDRFHTLSPEVAMAQAQRRARTIMQEMEQAEKHGGAVGRFVDAKTDLELVVTRLSDQLFSRLEAILTPVLKGATRILEGIENMDFGSISTVTKVLFPMLIPFINAMEEAAKKREEEAKKTQAELLAKFDELIKAANESIEQDPLAVIRDMEHLEFDEGGFVKDDVPALAAGGLGF